MAVSLWNKIHRNEERNVFQSKRRWETFGNAVQGHLAHVFGTHAIKWTHRVAFTGVVILLGLVSISKLFLFIGHLAKVFSDAQLCRSLARSSSASPSGVGKTYLSRAR